MCAWETRPGVVRVCPEEGVKVRRYAGLEPRLAELALVPEKKPDRAKHSARLNPLPAPDRKGGRKKGRFRGWTTGQDHLAIGGVEA